MDKDEEIKKLKEIIVEQAEIIIEFRRIEKIKE